MTDPQPWHQWTDEPDAAYAALSEYIRLGWPRGMGGSPVPRLLGALARKISKDPQWLQDCLHTWHWRERAQEYDRAVRRAQDGAVADAAYDATAALLEAAGYLSKALLNEAHKLHEKSTTSAEPIKPNEAARLLETLTKTQQLLNGKPTERVEVDHGVDLDALDADELLELSRLLSKGSTKG